MAPYFETVKVSTRLPFRLYLILPALQSFADVPITADGVETASFLEASDGLVNMFGMSHSSSERPMINIDHQFRFIGSGDFLLRPNGPQKCR